MMRATSRALRLTTHFMSSPLSNSRVLWVDMPISSKDSGLEPCSISSMRGISTASQTLSVPGQPRKFDVDHYFRKGKTALCMHPIAPEFILLDSGAMRLSRQGSMLLSFAPAVGRFQYDWDKKQVFGLSVTEIGTLLSLSPSEQCEFFHDPFKGKSNAGKVSKILNVEPMPDTAGYFFNLKISNKMENIETHFKISISNDEFAVMQSAFNFTLPYIMGLHAYVNSTRPY